MRIVLGLLSVLMAAVLAQPALAVCVIRGGATQCEGEGKLKPAHYTKLTEADPATASPSTNGQTIVLQPSVSGTAAWVLTPQNAAGAAVESTITTQPAACVNC